MVKLRLVLDIFHEKNKKHISKNILVRAMYTEMLVSPLFFLKLKVSNKMETQIQNHGIKLCLRFLLCFCLSMTKCNWEWKLSKNNVTLMDFKGSALRNSWIFVNVGFYETSQVIIFAYTWVFVGIFGKWIFFKKNHDFRETFWKIYFRIILRGLISKYYIPKIKETLKFIVFWCWRLRYHYVVKMTMPYAY